MRQFSGDLFGGCQWPVIQRYPLDFAAGASQEINFARPGAVNVYVTVRQGIAELYLHPYTQQPGAADSAPDFIIGTQAPFPPLEFAPGDTRFTIVAAGGVRLRCVVVVMRKS